MSDVQEADPIEERHHIQRFMDRVKYLIMTDPDLSVAECVGCLHMLAHELAAHGMFPEWFEDES
jgi:hypothetical protein